MKPYPAVVCHPGTQHARHIARELARRGLLSGFHTGIVVRSEGWFGKALHVLANGEFSSRFVEGVPERQLRRYPWLEAKAVWKLRRGQHYTPVLSARNVAFQTAVPDAAIKEAAAVIGFDTASWILAERASALGRHFILDQSALPSSEQHKLLRSLLGEDSPAYRATIAIEAELVSHTAFEQQHATKVVCASSFTKRALIQAGVSHERISVIPYGIEPGLIVARPKANPVGRALRFLYVGNLSQIKGVPFLLEAFARHHATARVPAQLILVGKGSVEAENSTPNVEFRGKLSHQEVLKEMDRADVFVFPSLADGFGMVLLEALARGMPIIASLNSAGADLVRTAENGVLIEPGSVESLLEAFEFFADNVRRFDQLSEAALQSARQFSWTAYGDRWAEVLRSLPSPK